MPVGNALTQGSRRRHPEGSRKLLLLMPQLKTLPWKSGVRGAVGEQKRGASFVELSNG